MNKTNVFRRKQLPTPLPTLLSTPLRELYFTHRQRDEIQINQEGL